MGKKIAIHQSQYLPWYPYFKKIALADEFVLMDCVQFQRNGIQNRNKIRNCAGSFWLTIPVSGRLSDNIMEMRLSDTKWPRKHWTSIKSCYAKSPFWGCYADSLEKLYQAEYDNLDTVNRAFIQFIKQALRIETSFVRLSELAVEGRKSDLILNICRERGATTYLSGLGAKDYLDQEAFESAGISIEYLPSEPPEYTQFQGDFIPGLSILDMMFNVDADKIGETLVTH